MAEPVVRNAVVIFEVRVEDLDPDMPREEIIDEAMALVTPSNVVEVQYE